jgi:hypothetical protein
MSRRAPVSSYRLPLVSTPRSSATVSWTWDTTSRFQIRSIKVFPKRKTSRFWTVSLPR